MVDREKSSCKAAEVLGDLMGVNDVEEEKEEEEHEEMRPSAARGRHFFSPEEVAVSLFFYSPFPIQLNLTYTISHK